MNQIRDGGFRDFESSIQWNQEFKNRQIQKNEYRIDTTN